MFEGYQEYKKVEIPWLQEVPSHWNIQRAKNMYRKMNRPIDKNDDVITCFRDGTVTLRKNKRTMGFTESIKEIGYQGIKKGDLIIHIMDAFAGAIGVSDSNGKGTPVYTVCTAKGDYNNYYYAYVIREMAKQGFIQSLYRGIRERSSDFRYEVFGKQLLPLPPRSEQDQIVRYLDWKVSMINKYINAKKKQIERLKEYKRAIINKAVTKGLDMNVSMKDSGIEWLGKMPAHWNILYLFQVAEEQYISNKEVHNQNLLSLSYGNIVNKDINTTEGLLPASFDTYQVVKPGNVILRLTDLQNDWKSLRVGLASQTGIITSAYVCLFCKDIILPEYLYLLLHSFDICKVFYGMGGGVRQSIGYKEIKKLLLLIPSQVEQQKIANYCKTIIVETDNNISQIENAINLLQEYRTRLISDVVTGKVNAQNVKVPKFIVDNQEDQESTETEGNE